MPHVVAVFTEQLSSAAGFLPCYPVQGLLDYMCNLIGLQVLSYATSSDRYT